MERRKQYRIKIGNGDGLEVGILLDDGSVVVGQPLDLMVDGAGVCFTRPSCPTLEMGHPVTLRFLSDKLEEAMEATALVVYRIEDIGFRRYGFRFTNCEELKKQLTPVVYRLFNRRGSHRIEPDPAKPIVVTVEATAGGKPSLVEVIDISATGIAVRVASAVEETFVSTSEIKLAIALPGSRDTLVFSGNILNRHLEDKGVRYNIVFDLEETAEAQQRQDLIIDYVMNRQREMWMKAQAA